MSICAWGEKRRHSKGGAGGESKKRYTLLNKWVRNSSELGALYSAYPVEDDRGDWVKHEDAAEQRYGQVWLIQEQDARAYQRGRRGTKRQR